MSKQNITLDITEKSNNNGDDLVGDDSVGDDSVGDDSVGDDSVGDDSVGDDSVGDDSVGDDSVGDDYQITLEHQKKIDNWLKEEQNNLKELEHLRKMQEQTFKTMQKNIDIKKNLLFIPNLMQTIQKKQTENHIKSKKIFKKQLRKKYNIAHFKMKLF